MPVYKSDDLAEYLSARLVARNQENAGLGDFVRRFKVFVYQGCKVRTINRLSKMLTYFCVVARFIPSTTPKLEHMEVKLGYFKLSIQP